MRGYYSVQAPHNLLSWTVNSRFADHISAIGEPPGEASGRCQHYLGSPSFRDTSRKLFPSCLSSPVSASKDDLDPKDLRRELKALRIAAGQTAA